MTQRWKRPYDPSSPLDNSGSLNGVFPFGVGSEPKNVDLHLMGVGHATTTNGVHELPCRRPPTRRVVPVIPAGAPQYDAISIAVCRFELKLPVDSVDELKLFRRTIVILRPKIEIDWLAGTKRTGFDRRCLGAIRPCRLIVIKRVHRWEEGVDMAG
jgi:hypothetical protein